MNKQHKKWEDFCDKLDEALWDEEGECRCDHNLRRTVAILDQYSGIDAKASIENFIQLGAFCDCEVVYNIIWDEE